MISYKSRSRLVVCGSKLVFVARATLFLTYTCSRHCFYVSIWRNYCSGVGASLPPNNTFFKSKQGSCRRTGCLVVWRARETDPTKHTHDQYYLVIVIKMLVLGLQEGRKRSFLFLPRPRTNILYTIRKNLLLGGSGASLLPPNKDSSFTCITRVNRSLVGRAAPPLPTTKDLVSPG